MFKMSRIVLFNRQAEMEILSELWCKNVRKRGEEVTHNFSYSSDDILEAIEKIIRLQGEYKEQKLAEIITKYDFIVGSKECKLKLMEVLPEGANIICSPYIESPTTIYAIKKFDAMDLIMGTQIESEGEE